MEDESEIIDEYFNDDGNALDQELVTKPALCLSCRKDNDPQEEELCMLTRMDNIDGEEFVCGAYEKIT
jgi:hypothetical protein